MNPEVRFNRHDIASLDPGMTDRKDRIVLQRIKERHSLHARIETYRARSQAQEIGRFPGESQNWISKGNKTWEMEGRIGQDRTGQDRSGCAESELDGRSTDETNETLAPPVTRRLGAVALVLVQACGTAHGGA